MLYDNLVLGAGLQSLYNGITNNWLKPAFLIMVAVGAFLFIRSQQLTKLVLFLVVCAVVGVLIFFGDGLFGADGAVSKMFNSNISSVSSGDGGLGGN